MPKTVLKQGRILAAWILAAKLPNSDLNFAVDVLVDCFLLFFPRRKAQKNPPKNPPRNSPGTCSEKFPSDFCRSLFLTVLKQVRNKNAIEAAILNRVLDRDSTLSRRGPLRGYPSSPCYSGTHREGLRDGAELLKDLHRVLKNPPPPLKKPPPPLLKKRPHLLFPLLNKRS